MNLKKDSWNIKKISNYCHKSDELFMDNEEIVSELVFENGILIEPEEQLRKYIKIGNMKENSKYIITCCILILILGLYIVLAEIPIISFGSSGGGEFPTP